MRAKKSLGQHFLLHKQIAQRMVGVARVGARDTVVEIGPGTGKLTDALLEKAKKVIALEADKNLVTLLEKKYTHHISGGCLEVHHQDIRLFDPATITVPYVLVANIPYYLTSSILRQFLETNHQPERMVLLVQKEVAKRIAQDKKESILSVSVKIFGDPVYEFVVPRGAFFPAPSVDSAVLSIQNIYNPFETQVVATSFFSVVRAGFSHKRKKLVNNLSALSDAHTAQQALISSHIAPDARAEDIPVEKWRLLAQHFPGQSSTPQKK
ncbi:MAG TPA: ribosomal RNA small subunit methyltransferase A [Candidatus Kaiserbacteria bacterium]|nr:ribosomal RNA small subunit methyltransferase A [Candidatus Kaiserbacteria bacterium]